MNRAYVRSLLISAVACLPTLAAANIAELDQDALTVSETDALSMNETLDPEFIEEIKPDPKPYSVSLMKATHSPATQRLDWRAQEVDLRFDLLEADQVDTLSVLLSANAIPGLNPDIPLTVQFNGGTPVEIDTQGQGFETVIDLPATRARKSGNVLTLSYDTPCHASWGGYEIDLQESRLDVGVMPRSQAFQLRELETLFQSPTFAPLKIGLVSGGAEQTKLQALAAQAVGLRMSKIPEFRLSSGEADLDIIMVRREQLLGYTESVDILSATGAQIALSDTEPNRLFLTGDTDAEVLQAVTAFSQSYLPPSRQTSTTLQDVAQQNPLDADRHLIMDRVTLDQLSVQTGLHREYVFDVTDPLSSQGELVLRLNRDRQTPKGTLLKTSLNGVSLGQAQVRGRRMTVSYPIEPGLLKGQDNRLELVTSDPDTRPHCDASDPFIAISDGSELRLINETPTPDSDLSRFAADGSLFAENLGSNTVMVLPDRDLDYTNALALVAKLAKTNGRGWANADFVRGYTDNTDANLLYIEPYSGLERSVRLNAPQALQSAWRGHSVNEEDAETVEQFASLNGEQAMRQAAQLIWTESTLGAGGVAALYPNSTGQLIGIISNTQGISFSEAISPLITGPHWNKLKGGVAHWNEDVVMMTQTAFELSPPEVSPSEDAEFDVSLTQRVKAVASVVADIDWPEPEPAALGAWLDQRWTRFSTTIRAQAQSPQVIQVRTAVSDKIHAVPDAAREALGSERVADIRRDTLDNWDERIVHVKALTADWRRDLWTHLDIDNPELKSAGIGQAQVLPIILGLSIIFLMILVGLAFAPARSSLR